MLRFIKYFWEKFGEKVRFLLHTLLVNAKTSSDFFRRTPFSAENGQKIAENSDDNIGPSTRD
jgi:hypothetical protein